MDTSASSSPDSTDGQLGPVDEDDDSQHDPSFLTRLLQRASGALGHGYNGADEHPEDAVTRALRDCSAAEQAMVVNILRMREQRVEDVMTPRADITAVPATAELDDVMRAFARDSLSRVPVYRETLDDPIGFVHLKDLALTYGVGCAEPEREFDLSKHIRPALFVPPSMRIAALMQRMQAARVHMALVIDEFGGVDGLLTIEDLVEQIVGDIEDEHDEEELALWRQEHPGVYLVNARADIDEFEQAEGIELLPGDWDEEAETVGGLVVTLANRVPARGEVIGHPGGHEFEVLDADPRRIKRLRLTLSGAGPAAGSREAAE